MPMPRGSRPSTAALTRFDARKANEMAILTCRTIATRPLGNRASGGETLAARRPVPTSQVMAVVYFFASSSAPSLNSALPHGWGRFE